MPVKGVQANYNANTYETTYNNEDAKNQQIADKFAGLFPQNELNVSMINQ